LKQTITNTHTQMFISVPAFYQYI